MKTVHPMSAEWLRIPGKALIACLGLGCVVLGLAASSCASGSAGLSEAAVTSGTVREKPQRNERQPIPGGPVLLRDDLSIRKFADVPAMGVRLTLNPADGSLYYVHGTQGIFRLETLPAQQTSPPAGAVLVQRTVDIIDGGVLAGFVFADDGTAYAVANRPVGTTQTQAIILRGSPVATNLSMPENATESASRNPDPARGPGTPPGSNRSGDHDAPGSFAWTIVASTEPYALSAAFDHTFNGIAVSPDGAWLFVNSGSRTDHGEVQSNKNAFPDMREVPIGSAIFKIPADTTNLLLRNDESALRPYLFADGVRNAYDLVFAPNGDLFAGDNGPDADYPDELNWIRAGKHYGFPWRFGAQDNPQQFPEYDPREDPRLSIDFNAVRTGAYKNDPGFPSKPANLTDAIANAGPDAVQFRDNRGDSVDAYEQGTTVSSFTPHRSPLGLVFVDEHRLPADLAPGPDAGLSAFILSWGAAGGSLSDEGRDLLHLSLRKQGQEYVMESSQIAKGFKNPIDAVLVGNKLYVLEWDRGGAVWEVSFASE